MEVLGNCGKITQRATVAVLACAAVMSLGGAIMASAPAAASDRQPATGARATAAERLPRHRAQARACMPSGGTLALTSSRRARGERASCRRARVLSERRAHRPRSHATPVGEAEPASVIARALNAPCPNTQMTPEAGNLPAAREAVLCLINRERAQNGETPLRLNSQLSAAAEAHTREMISQDYFDHVSPSGLTPVGRVKEAGYIHGPGVGYVIGENLAWGTLSLATPQSIVAAWIASPGHLANILEGQYRDTGIAVAPEVPAALSGGMAGALYTQEFGVIIH